MILGEKGYEINKHWKKPSQSSSPSVSRQQTEHHQLSEVRNERADKLSLRFSWLFSEIRHAYRASQNAATDSPLSRSSNKSMFSFCQPKYAYKAVIRVRAAKKLHCAQQRGKSESGPGCDGACCPLEQQMRVFSLLWGRAK